MRQHLGTVTLHSAERWLLMILTSVSLALNACQMLDDSHKIERPPLSEVTVCELFKDVSAASGSKIAVRGIYYFGLRGSGCRPEIVAGGRSWPVALDLADSSVARDAAIRSSIVTDRTGWNRLDE